MVLQSQSTSGGSPFHPASCVRNCAEVSFVTGASPRSVVADHFRRHPLPSFHFLQRIRQRLQIRVRVDIDKAGADKTAIRVNRAFRRGAFHRTDCGDAVPLYGDIGPLPRIARPVNDLTADDQKIVHSRFRHISSQSTRGTSPTPLLAKEGKGEVASFAFRG